MVKLLQDLLYLEAKDKEFLLANITRVTRDKDEWSFDGIDTSDTFYKERRRATDILQDCYAESCSTWNFRKDHRNGNVANGGDSGNNSSNISDIVLSLFW